LNRKTSRIGKADDIARHLGRAHLETDPETGKVIGVFNTAFDLKVAKKEREASVNHLQYFAGDMLDQLKSIKADMVNTGYTVGNQSAYAVVKVGTVETCGKDSGVSLAVYRRPLERNESHAGLRGLPLDNSNIELRERLAQAASRQVFAAANL
jgi:hypothetical protein